MKAKLLAGYKVGPDGDGQYYGDYVKGSVDPVDGFAISSVAGAVPWYYTVTPDGQLRQGDNVFALCASSGLEWEWNETAIRQIALMGHTLGEHTLHKRIFRMPSGSHVRLVNGRIEKTHVTDMANWVWDRDEPEFDTLLQTFRDCLPSRGDVHLSLSGGYDSRLLLALCVAERISPLLTTMGTRKAMDIKLAKLLSARLGLPLRVVEVDENDYIKYGEDISYDTSGVKTAGDWHTWLFSKEIEQKDGINLVGSNAGFAKTQYYDFVSRSVPIRILGKRGVKPYIFVRSLNRSRKYALANRIVSPLHALEVARSPGAIEAWYPKGIFPALDTYFSCERMRHFIGSGYACYQRFTNPKSPYLDERWMRSVAAVKRHYKLRKRYNRLEVEKFCAALDEIPYNVDPDGGNITPYSPFNKLRGSSEVAELIIESHALDVFLGRTSRRKLFARKTIGRDDLSLLLTLHFAAVNAGKIHRRMDA